MAKEKSTEEKLKAGEIEIITPESDPNDQNSNVPDFTMPTFESFIPILAQLRGLKKTLTAAPTFIPKNVPDSFQFYDSGGVRRLYLYVNKTWRYVVLT
jgi:hypothetical protein